MSGDADTSFCLNLHNFDTTHEASLCTLAHVAFGDSEIEARRLRQFFFVWALLLGAFCLATTFVAVDPSVSRRFLLGDSQASGTFWFCGGIVISTCLVAPFAIYSAYWGTRTNDRSLRRLAVLMTFIGILTLFFCPAVNMVVSPQSRAATSAFAKRLRADVGEDAEDVAKRFGRPAVTKTEGSQEVWRYYPGPWYSVMRLDAVVVVVDGGRVTDAYVHWF